MRIRYDCLEISLLLPLLLCFRFIHLDKRDRTFRMHNVNSKIRLLLYSFVSADDISAICNRFKYQICAIGAWNRRRIVVLFLKETKG